MAASTANVESITALLDNYLSKVGFEVYPLKVGWYNSLLPSTLRLAHPDDCLAVVVLSTPALFEQAFLPFMEERGCQGLSDPIDQCVKRCVSSAVSQCFPGQEVDVRYDYELLPSRKPKFLAQTAAHVSGAAYYYQQSDVKDQPWAEKKMFGVCVHPRFGGWFAIRALLVFGGVTVGSEWCSLLLLTVCHPERAGFSCWRPSTIAGRTGATETSSARSRSTLRNKKTTLQLLLLSGLLC
ncbi:Methylmalonic aciduria and homocystinuria type C protein like [Dissostichus eleginoides]|uniref:Cyanocobalamin reductase / alkylcobalamin dealkylase n=1 Tax=Dissostichus eleginoides TaxID=100907 RepID=A0AAD9C958_DISEL|nr:Methylmalonic aciduria and homocystinuria type C protein like [Dissostichus eleginoides]